MDPSVTLIDLDPYTKKLEVIRDTVSKLHYCTDVLLALLTKLITGLHKCLSESDGHDVIFLRLSQSEEGCDVIGLFELIRAMWDIHFVGIVKRFLKSEVKGMFGACFFGLFLNWRSLIFWCFDRKW